MEIEKTKRYKNGKEWKKEKMKMKKYGIEVAQEFFFLGEQVTWIYCIKRVKLHKLGDEADPQQEHHHN